MDIQGSLDAILAEGTQFSEAFYHQLSVDHPDVFAHFHQINLKHQVHMLNTALLLCVQENRHPNKSLKYYLRLLGTKHNRLGIEREAYKDWTKTMLRSLETYHGKKWSEGLAKEWQSAIDSATTQMFIGYDEPYHM